VAAIPRGMAVAASARSDGRVRVIDARDRRAVELRGAADARAFGGWTNYVAAAVRRLAANFPGADLGADVAFASDVPRSAGMSSSSALVTGITLAVAECAGLDRRPEWRASIERPLDLAAYCGAIENGSTFRGLSGHTGVGTSGGSEDHTAILTCRAGQVSMYRYLPSAHLADAAMPEAWRFVLMTSGVHASKTGAARGSYNRAAEAVAALVRIARDELGANDALPLAAILDRDPDTAERLRARAAAGHGGFSGEVLTRRLDHFVAEDARVPLATTAFSRADAAALGDLSGASQAAAEADLGNQVPETIRLADLAREQGAFAASSFGAGFGGSVWALIEGGAAEGARMAQRWQAAYLAACPHIRQVDWIVAAPGPAALRLRHGVR
jgi:galactokinase